MDWLKQLSECLQAQTPVALVTVVDTGGSTPRKAGAKMLVLSDGRIEGTIGGGHVEHAVVQVALESLKSNTPRQVEFALTNELGMCCGGKMSFFVEPMNSRPPLLVFGAGHVGRAIVHAASRLNFAITVIDGANPVPFDDADPIRCIDSFEPADLEELPFGDNTYIVIATREHRMDQRLLELCCTRRWAYLGVIGSQRKAHLQRQRLANKGIAKDVISRIHCPMGKDIGAQTPEEIAISVCAELIEVRGRLRAYPAATV